jgi:hypothetical protein
MTSLDEGIHLNSDPLDRAAEHADDPFILGDRDFDVRAKHDQTALLKGADHSDVVTPPDLVERRYTLTAFVTMLLDGVRGTLARSPKRPRRQRKHYPPRFSLEFETSLVDRERRRL